LISWTILSSVGGEWCWHDVVFSAAAGLLSAPLLVSNVSIRGRCLSHNPVAFAIIAIFTVIYLEVFLNRLLPDAWLHDAQGVSGKSLLMPALWGTGLLAASYFATALSRGARLCLLIALLLSGMAPYLAEPINIQHLRDAPYQRMALMTSQGDLISPAELMKKIDIPAAIKAAKTAEPGVKDLFFELYVIDTDSHRVAELERNRAGGIDLMIYDLPGEYLTNPDEGSAPITSTVLGAFMCLLALMTIFGLSPQALWNRRPRRGL
jgi:hypothetical protein